jgi:hypothetical protein
MAMPGSSSSLLPFRRRTVSDRLGSSEAPEEALGSIA